MSYGVERKLERLFSAPGALPSGFVAGVTGLEPATSGVTGQRSNQLSYTPTKPPHVPPPGTGVKQLAAGP